MGCNAHNHAPDCNCGWGGIFHGLGNSKNALQWPTAPGSFINPNANCPVCKAPVFFYRSPDGGCVFFDNLGPPWPKHPCTVRDASKAIPSSLYWKAKANLDAIRLKKVDMPPLRVLLGSQKVVDQWLIEVLQRWIGKSFMSPLVALWVLDLPPDAVGINDVDFTRVKWITTVKIAYSIQRYFEGRKAKRTELRSIELARFLIETDNKKIQEFGVNPQIATSHYTQVTSNPKIKKWTRAIR